VVRRRRVDTGSSLAADLALWVWEARASFHRCDLDRATAERWQARARADLAEVNRWPEAERGPWPLRLGHYVERFDPARFCSSCDEWTDQGWPLCASCASRGPVARSGAGPAVTTRVQGPAGLPDGRVQPPWPSDASVQERGQWLLAEVRALGQPSAEQVAGHLRRQGLDATVAADGTVSAGGFSIDLDARRIWACPAGGRR
jgi:hypothetical protein